MWAFLFADNTFLTTKNTRTFMIAIVLTAVISATVGVGTYIVVSNAITKTTVRKRREALVEAAKAEGEMIRKEKELHAT